MLDLTTALHEKVWEKKGSDGSKPPPIEPTQEDSTDPMYRPKHFSQIGVNYRKSDIVFDERISGSDADGEGQGEKGASWYHSSTTLQAGDRAPDADLLIHGESKKLFGMLKPYLHTALLFSGKAHPISEVTSSLLEALPEDLVQSIFVLPQGSAKSEGSERSSKIPISIDSAGSAYTDYGISPTDEKITCVLLRPDGIVGAFARSNDGVRKYFERVLGSEGKDIGSVVG